MTSFGMTLFGMTSFGMTLLRSGLLEPPSPRAAFRLLRSVSLPANPRALVAIAAARWPNRTAVIDDAGAISYAELLERTDSLAAQLVHDHGVGPGTSVGVLCRNGRGFIQAVLAIAATGADTVLLNTDFKADALSASVTSHRIGLVVADSEFTTLGVTTIAPEPTQRRSRPPTRRPGRIVVLTSGTTGTPKGVPRTPQVVEMVGVAASILDRTRLRAGSRVAIAVPFFHAFGLAIVVLTLGLGGTILTRRKFDAETALAQASLHRADALAVVPIMLSRILDLPERVKERNPVRSLRLVVSGAAPLDPTLAIRFMDAFGDILCNGYGSSEVGIGAFATPADLRRSPGTVGRPVAGSPVRILDDGDEPVPTGTIGRIFVGGKLRFEGYTNGATKATVANLTSTGDMGYLDEHGCLFVVGREDDMIVSGGENVYPSAVENALARHPGVADNAVVGVPDDAFGQRLAAFVVGRPDVELDVGELRDYLKARVSRFEQPRDIHLVGEIPRNPAGKVLRRTLTA